MDASETRRRHWMVGISLDCVLQTRLTVGSLLVMNFFMNLNVYTQNVYEPYATSHFDGHSLLATGSIVNGIVRIVSYPLLAKLADVCPIATPITSGPN